MTNTDINPARDLARAMPPAPTPKQIKQARSAAGQTQQQAAALVYVDGRAWRRWESGDRQMDAAHWELYQIKVIGLTPDPVLRVRLRRLGALPNQGYRVNP